jgi:AcrR family transcriptional regulator
MAFEARTVPTRAERRDRTVAELVDAAERLFVGRGFHATTVDQVAAEAGYTKGAVYSNFASKEDLFFAVYERRAATFADDLDRRLREQDVGETLHALARDTTTRRGREDGWLAVYFEFWAHVLRHPELRARFAAVRRRSRRPMEDALERFAADHGGRLPMTAVEAVTSMNAAQLGLALERLTDPGAIDADLGERVSRLALEQLASRLVPTPEEDGR